MSASSHSSSFPTTLLSSGQWQRLLLQSLAMKSTQSTQDLLQGQLLLVALMITFPSIFRVNGCRPLWLPKSKSFFALPIWLEATSLVLLIFVSCLCFWAVGFVLLIVVFYLILILAFNNKKTIKVFFFFFFFYE
jgi:hypothetical protein